jgi:hypothetical protein
MSCKSKARRTNFQDHDLLERVKFPAIRTLDPPADDTSIIVPVLASADLAKLTRQIQASQAVQDEVTQPSKWQSRAHRPFALDRRVTVANDAGLFR